MLENTTKDERSRRYLGIQKILSVGGDKNTFKGIENLLDPKDGQATFLDENFTQISYLQKRPYILLDFGVEIYGGLQIVTGGSENLEPVKARINFGESVIEALSKPVNQHSIAQTIIDLPFAGCVEIGNLGFRFAKIELLEPDSYVSIRSIRAICYIRDLEYKGLFESSDNRLNKIWQTGAYTVHLNMQQYLWDGIKRDQLVWAGDLGPEVMVINSVFGQHEIVEKSLDFLRDETPFGSWMNGIPSYSIWWIIVQYNWYLYHGDIDYLAEQRSYLDSLIMELAKFIDRNNNEKLPEMRFLDWPTSKNKEALHGGLQCLMIMAFENASNIYKALGIDESYDYCRKITGKLKLAKVKSNGVKQVEALKVLAKIEQPEIANDKLLSVNHDRDISTFYGYYILQARAMAGDFQGCVETIRSYWGKMLDLGATTFWEDFDLSWAENAGRIDKLPVEGEVDLHAVHGDYCYKGLRMSLCHGWSAGPTAWIMEHILGLKPLVPGFKFARFSPNLCDLNWARGKIPTPYGVIEVEVEKDKNGKYRFGYKAPSEIDMVVEEQKNTAKIVV